MKLQILKNEEVVKEIDLTIALDVLLIVACVFGIYFDFTVAQDYTLSAYCILAIILTGITWLPKYRWYKRL